MNLRRWLSCCCALLLYNASVGAAHPKPKSGTSVPDTTVAHLVQDIHARAKMLEGGSGMLSSFQSFTLAYKIKPGSVRYSGYGIARLLYEAARGAGFWNLHWTIRNMPPNSDQVWRQWKTVQQVSPLRPTPLAECDELSALYAFLVERSGVRRVGLLWPYPNHAVAVWVVHPTNGAHLRVAVPTSQIFLNVDDSFATRKFNPWHQKTIYEYTRHDVPDRFQLPRPLFDYFLEQVPKYGGASDSALQQIRYLREGVFLKDWTPERAAKDALDRKKALGFGSSEDLNAFQNFASDMRAQFVH